jgi:hypothetical protein
VRTSPMQVRDGWVAAETTVLMAACRTGLPPRCFAGSGQKQGLRISGGMVSSKP